ncbi:replication protein [Alishewanella sp. d11]|uniref:replication protein n=1 Tax=Alishewanella sp. d11 TaxID=3414030 RepID=UPI003BF9253D
MTAVNLIDFNAKRNGGGQVIADTDDGYTRTANAIQDQLCRLDISGTQFQVLNAIIRSTYGYNKKQDRVTNTYLAELTGISEKSVRKALEALTERKIITCTKSGIMKLVAVNKVVSEWVVKSGKAENLSRNAEQMVQRNKCSNKAEQMVQQVGINGSSERNKCSNTKDNLPKTTNQRQIIMSPPTADDAPIKPDSAIQKGKHWGTAEDLAIANQFEAILKNTLGEHHRPPNMALWANDIRLMRTQDKRDPKHMVSLFALAHTDNFWKTNMHSPAALRKHWARLASLYNERKAGYGNGQKGITIGADGKPMTGQDWGKKARELAVNL